MIGEAALVALAAAIYLFDCVVLLERGQALITASAVSFGSRHYQIAGKSVAVMNPFTPFLFAFRSLPLFSYSGKEGVKLSKAVAAVRLVAPFACAQLLILFMALPYCLYRAPGWPFAIALLLAYVNAIAMLVFLFLNFRRHSISARPLAGLGFGWIVCLPLSVNCLRAAGVSIPLQIDATRAIRVVPDREKARRDLAAQVAEAMEEVEETDAQHSRLAELARSLKPEAGHERL